MSNKEVWNKIFKLRIQRLTMTFLSIIGISGIGMLIAMVSSLSDNPSSNVEEIDVSPIITIEEIGYDISHIEESKINGEKNLYTLIMYEKENDEKENYFDITIYKQNDKKSADDEYISLIKAIKYLEAKRNKNCLDCKLYKTTNNGDVLKYVYKFDITGVDKVHLLYDWTDLPTETMSLNYMFLQKDNIIIKIGFKSNLIIEDQTLKLFSQLFERSKSIFE